MKGVINFIFLPNNLEVLINIYMKLNLNITNKHIQNGTFSDPSNCAIAKAMKAKLGQGIKVGVFPDRVYLEVKKNNNTRRYKGAVSKKIAQFIKRFDAGLPVSPFKLTFSLSKAKSILV